MISPVVAGFVEPAVNCYLGPGFKASLCGRGSFVVLGLTINRFVLYYTSDKTPECIALNTPISMFDALLSYQLCKYSNISPSDII